MDASPRRAARSRALRCRRVSARDGGRRRSRGRRRNPRAKSPSCWTERGLGGDADDLCDPARDLPAMDTAARADDASPAWRGGWRSGGGPHPAWRPPSPRGRRARPSPSRRRFRGDEQSDPFSLGGEVAGVQLGRMRRPQAQPGRALASAFPTGLRRRAARHWRIPHGQRPGGRRWKHMARWSRESQRFSP